MNNKKRKIENKKTYEQSGEGKRSHISPSSNCGSLTRPAPEQPPARLCIWGVGYHTHFGIFVAAEFCTWSISHIGLKTPEVPACVSQSEVPATCTVDSLHNLCGSGT